ncbi:hypothetical protein ACMFMG_011943 [Clarireedia jacksonii]
MPKEKSINPAQAARKAEKAKAIKKGKATLQAQKTERLAKKNPFHLQKQLDELKAVEESGGKLTAHEKKLVEGLEKELKAVKKAREEKGVVDEPRGGRGGRGGFHGGRGGAGVLGKRRRDGDTDESESDEVDEETKRIPMPRDTPPPIPKEVLDKWYAKRRERWQKRNANANETPLGGNDRGSFGGNGSGLGSEKAKVEVEVKTVYEAKPVIRDLRKEATAFVPAVVRQKMQRGKGEGGGLMEEEELERLEREGYVKGMGGARGGEGQREVEGGSRGMEGGEGKEVGVGVGEMNVEMEEVEDEDA